MTEDILNFENEESKMEMPASVRFISLEDKEIYLIGTAHVSHESVEDVRKTVSIVAPDAICIELCEARFASIEDKQNWQKMDIIQILKQKKGVLLIAQLIMSSFYKKLGSKLGITPGAEMLEGAKLANETGAQLVLADRNVQITLRRTWGYLSLWSKIKLATQLLMSFFSSEDIDEKMIEEMKQKDQMEALMGEFAVAFPEIKRRLIDERDLYLAEKIRTAPGNKIVAIVGAGHCAGIEREIRNEHDLLEITRLPPKSKIGKIIAWGIPSLIVGLIVYGFFSKGAATSTTAIWIWLLVHGALSALGTAIAFGHPLTILVAFVASPFTSLNPMIAAGWVAGLTQAWVKRPTVKDFESLQEDVMTLKGWWRNPVSRVLLVVVFANLGSALGTFISGGWIATHVF